MNIMNYKGYLARIEYSDEDDCFVGHIAGINNVVGFHGDSVSELHRAFEEAVDNYIETCKKAKRSPQKTLFRAYHVACAARIACESCNVG